MTLCGSDDLIISGPGEIRGRFRVGLDTLDAMPYSGGMDKGEGCEICGDADSFIVPAPSGGTMDACEPCERRENEQHAIDLESVN